MEKSKTQQAIELVDAGAKPYAAAREVGLSPNALYLALKKRREQQGVEPCPCCGTLVPADKINPAVLKDRQTYDTGCLRVWPEWGSSGIWHPEKQMEDGQVRMVGYESLGLPERLCQEFAAWIDWFDECAPENPDGFPCAAFDRKGERLAHELAQIVGDRYAVEYHGLRDEIRQIPKDQEPN